MDLFRESALERKGAQAAAHGQHWQSNPFLVEGNMPQASGESLGDWSRQHDAWQRGFEGYFRQGPEFARRRRQQLSADLLKTMVERQLQRLPALRTLMGRPTRRLLGLSSSTKHARDRQEPDWDLEDYERSMVGTTRLDAELRAVVERLRNPCDMLPVVEAATLLNSMDPCPPDGGHRDPRPSAMSGPAGESPLPAQAPAVSVPSQPCLASPEAPAATDTPPYAAPAPEEQPLRRELGIRRIGWRYEYRGYRYDRLADAVAYASLNRAEPRREAAPEGSLPADEPPTMPSGDDRTLMATWDIGFDAGIYTFRNYRYERLCDAVAYAELLASRGDASASQEHRP
jgi:hypothetical protein